MQERLKQVVVQETLLFCPDDLVPGPPFQLRFPRNTSGWNTERFLPSHQEASGLPGQCSTKPPLEGWEPGLSHPVSQGATPQTLPAAHDIWTQPKDLSSLDLEV